MKKILKIVIGIIIFILVFIVVDGLCAKFLDTRPIIAKREVVVQGASKLQSGYVYKSLFSDVYYCNTIYESYDEENNLIREEKITRHYVDKFSEFVCPIYIYERAEILKPYEEEAIKYRNFDYMKSFVEGIYKAGYNFGSYNSKLGLYSYNSLGSSYVDYDHYGIYLFDVDDFSKEPIKMEIEGFDLTWRSFNMIDSPSGNIMAFYYGCGYRQELWIGSQKYTQEDCNTNSEDNGIYVFIVNGINDYSLLKFFPEARNEYLDDYKDSYFRIYDIIDDENIIIKYTVTNNKQLEPYMEVYYKWNIIDDTLVEWQV